MFLCVGEEKYFDNSSLIFFDILCSWWTTIRKLCNFLATVYSITNIFNYVLSVLRIFLKRGSRFHISQSCMGTMRNDFCNCTNSIESDTRVYAYGVIRINS